LVGFGVDSFLSTTEVTISSSVAQLRVRGTEEQRERKRDAESGNATSEQLLMMPTEQLTNREWLPGEHLNLEETAARRQGDRDRAAERRLNESLEEAAARRQDRRDRDAERRLNESRGDSPRRQGDGQSS